MNDDIKTGKKIKPGLIILVIVVIVAAYFIYNAVGPGGAGEEATETAAAEEVSVEKFFSVNVARFADVGDGFYEVVGTVKNISMKTFNYVRVQVEFLDENGNVVGETTAFAAGQDEHPPEGMKSFTITTEGAPEWKDARGKVIEAAEVR